VTFAGLCFASLDATAKYLVLTHGLFLVVWARYAGQMVVSTPIAWSRGGPGFWRTRHLRIQLIRSLCLVTATACFFGSLRVLSLAEASAISFLAPMFAIVFSGPLLGPAAISNAFYQLLTRKIVGSRSIASVTKALTLADGCFGLA
jgi:drug/metabolite transporter (DMT)-like permease